MGSLELGLRATNKFSNSPGYKSLKIHIPNMNINYISSQVPELVSIEFYVFVLLYTQWFERVHGPAVLSVLSLLDRLENRLRADTI